MNKSKLKHLTEEDINELAKDISGKMINNMKNYYYGVTKEKRIAQIIKHHIEGIPACRISRSVYTSREAVNEVIARISI